MKIYFATWLFEKSQGEALSNVSADNRLISYFHTRELKHKVKKYVKTGKVPDDNLHGGDSPRDGRAGKGIDNKA